MRLWRAIPVSLLVFLPLGNAAQVVLSSGNATVVSTNIVDALSADPDYTSLLRLLQLAKLIPTLNRLNGSTLFAPTNDAIKRHSERNSIWRAGLQDDATELHDNIQEKLRQELFYHLLNYSIGQLPQEHKPEVLFTLHYPREGVEPPTRDPPPGPPWMPIPRGPLGGKPQRLRMSSRDATPFIGVDTFGDGGAKASKGEVTASNGKLVGIDEVLQVPPDLASVILSHPSLSYLKDILTSDIIGFLNSTSNLTLFLPVNSAWEALPHYERLYLESKYATDDLTRIVNMHAVSAKDVKYSESFESNVTLTTIDGPKLKISHAADSEKVNVSDSELVEPDIYASNGVVHTVSSLLVPPGSLQLTPEKYLLVLNCTSFVSLLHSVNLTSLINDTETHWTILAPKDDVINMSGHGDLPSRGSEELKKTLQYHFIPGKWPKKKLKDRMLLETALEEEGLDGGRQVLPVDVSEAFAEDKTGDKNIRFGGAGTLGDPVEVNNTLIYFISRPLLPPTDPLSAASSNMDLSYFLVRLLQTSLAEKLKTSPRLTLLLPHNSAFERLGMLVTTHLSSQSPASKADLERVIQHHAITGVEYANSIQNGSQRTYGTLEGSDLHVTREQPKGGQPIVLLSPSGGWPEMQSTLYPVNTLTQTGVIHEVSDVMIPRSVDITVGKLVRAAQGTIMASMVTKVGLEWILNGTAPPEGSPWADVNAFGWTLLCPTDDAFKGHDLTELYANTELLRDIVTQHLIPVQHPSKAPHDDVVDVVNNNRPLVFDDSTTYSTLLTGISKSLFSDIVFRDEGESTVVGIKGARGADGRKDWAHVVAWGRSTTGRGNGGVVQIDRLLMPYYPPWWVQYGGPAAVTVGGVILICLFFYGVRIIWNKDVTEATYEPVGGFGQDDEDS